MVLRDASASKNLKLNPARYHGGDFEGKSIQDMLECSRNKSFEILACISDKPDTHESFKKVLRILQQVSDPVVVTGC